MKNKIEGHKADKTDKKEDNNKLHEPETEQPISERDEVKKAEDRTREAQKKLKKLKPD